MSSVFLVFFVLFFFCSRYVLINSVKEAAMGHDRYFSD